MKPSTLIIAALIAGIAWACWCAEPKPTVLDAKIKEIKFYHQLNCDLSRSGIEAGYLACKLGWNLSNYLAAVQIAWDKNLADKITEASKP